MSQTLAKLTRAEYEKLCAFDYGDLYSIHHGLKHTSFGKYLQIFGCVNRYGKLYIQVNFYPEGHKRFDFDCLDDAVDWAKRRVTVIDTPKDEEKEDHGKHRHCTDCLKSGIFPDCQCLTCARDYGHTEDERGCCMVLNKRCGQECASYVKEDAK